MSFNGLSTRVLQQESAYADIDSPRSRAITVAAAAFVILVFAWVVWRAYMNESVAAQAFAQNPSVIVYDGRWAATFHPAKERVELFTHCRVAVQQGYVKVDNTRTVEASGEPFALPAGPHSIAFYAKQGGKPGFVWRFTVELP
jgi:hypothetical protein